jgi:hypothetical protein
MDTIPLFQLNDCLKRSESHINIIIMKAQIEYNQAVRTAYFKIIKQVKQLISTIDEEPLRGILERQDKPKSSGGYIVHEMLNAVLYIRLESINGSIFNIHYGYEQTDRFTKYYPITSAFIRLIYKYTSKENTGINIEDCIHTDWVVTNCAELFEYIGDRNKYHTYRNIKFRKPTAKKKVSLKVA